MVYRTLLPLPLDAIEPLPDPEPELRLIDLGELIDTRVSRGTTGCLIWHGNRNQRGTPYLKLANDICRSAQRLQYRRHFGPVPKGLVIGVTCALKSCMEPTHLEARKKRWRTYATKGQKFPKPVLATKPEPGTIDERLEQLVGLVERQDDPGRR